MYYTQQEVRRFHLRAFPDLTDAERPERILGKWREETREFMVATGQILPQPDEAIGRAAEEAADVVITLLGWAEFSNIDLALEIQKKLDILATRTFERQPDGTYERVK